MINNIPNGMPMNCKKKIKILQNQTSSLKGTTKKPTSSLMVNIKKIKEKTSQKTKPQRAFLYSLDLKFLHQPVKVSHYAQHIFDFYHENEKNRVLQMNWLTDSSNIKMRAKIVDFMILWSYYFKFNQETLYLAIFVMDQYLSKNKIDNKETSKIFVSSVLLATKFEESRYFSILDLLEHIKQPLSKEEIIEKEAHILETLDFNLSYTSPFDFIKRLCYLEEESDSIYERCSFMMEYFLYHQNVNSYTASEIAIASYFLTFELLSQKVQIGRLKKYFQFSQNKIEKIKAVMKRNLIETQNQGLDSINLKYKDQKFLKENLLKNRNVF